VHYVVDEQNAIFFPIRGVLCPPSHLQSLILEVCGAYDSMSRQNAHDVPAVPLHVNRPFPATHGLPLPAISANAKTRISYGFLSGCYTF